MWGISLLANNYQCLMNNSGPLNLYDPVKYKKKMCDSFYFAFGNMDEEQTN